MDLTLFNFNKGIDLQALNNIFRKPGMLIRNKSIVDNCQ